MLDTYKNGQPVAYNIMINAINNDKLSHAYLFNTNDNDDAIDIIFSFVKEIICNYRDLNERENIIKRIDDGNYLDVKVIEPDGIWIKKEQMLELQNEFSKKSIEGKKKIYIIKSAEKMNVQTANSLLKFLEEPIDDIIAILVTNNINLILPTIISRCQVIKLNKKNFFDSTIENFSSLLKRFQIFLSLEEKEKFINDVVNFINYLEKNGIDLLIYTRNMWHNNFKNRESNILAIEVMIYFYYDVLKLKMNDDVNFFKDRIDDVKDVSDTNSLEILLKKIEYLDDAEYNLKRNLNINLLIDKLILDMCGDEL